MTRSSRACFAVPLAGVLALLAPARALAQGADSKAPSPPPQASAVPADAPPPTAEERAAMKKKAGAAYKRGRDLLKDKGACDARGSVADTTEALHAFLESLRLVPKPGTTFLAAVCHQALEHVEEALEFYETYLRIPGIPDELKLEAQKAVVALRGRVGTIVVEEAQRGAKIVVDGQTRGEYPAPTPVIAAAGKHLVQVYLAGFTPFEATIGVLPGEVTKVAARLTPLPRLGRIEVKERDGKTVDVLLDGSFVGKTPWQGQIAEGDHGVILRGDKDVGSQPVSVTIAGDKPANVTLAAERLDATLRVSPEPSGATVLIDTAFVGRGTFEGRLKPGDHTVKVVADGFAATTKQIKVAAGSDETVRIVLTRESAAALWQKPVEVVPQSTPGPRTRTWAWVVGGAGLVALGTAAVFGIDGLITKGSLDTLCGGDIAKCTVPNQNQADAVALVNAHKNRDLALFIGFATAGAIGVGVGLGGILTTPKAPAATRTGTANANANASRERSERTPGFTLTPIAGPGIGGASLGGTF